MLFFNLKVLKFKLEEAMKLYLNENKNLELLKLLIDEISCFITNKKNQVEYFNLKDNLEFKKYIVSIREISTKALGMIEKEEAQKIISNEKSEFNYGEELELAVKQEIYDYDMKKENNILFIGSGAMPITAFTISKEIGAKITCIDIDDEALNLSRKVAKKLGIYNIEFEKNLFNLDLNEYSHIIIASLVPLKCKILEELRDVDAKIILRYGNELKELFNYPICQKEIKKYEKTLIRDRNFIYDSLLLERDEI